jgi:hypothetical protein
MIPSIVGLVFVVMILWLLIGNDRRPGGGGGH